MPVIEIDGLTKTYKSGHQALKRIDLTIDKGEIFALLGPNGAGKTTLISIVCGIVTPTTGTVVADGHDIQSDFRAARTKIGLVPQELTTDAFETVLATVTFSRGLFGKAPNPAFLEGVLKDLSSKKVMLGVLDLGNPEIEPAEVVADRIRNGLKHVAADRLVVAPDCGMKYHSREHSQAKLKAMVDTVDVNTAGSPLPPDPPTPGGPPDDPGPPPPSPPPPGRYQHIPVDVDE